jgi:hypothetical protein
MRCAALMLLLCTAGVAQGAPRYVTPHGFFATAGFSSDDGACMETFVEVRVLTGRWAAPPAPPPQERFQYVEMTARVTNYCTGEDMLFAFATTSDFTFETDPPLDAARLVATFPAFFCAGALCPEESPLVTLDLTWTATGGFVRTRIDKFTRNTSREAVVSGTVDLGGLLLNPEGSGGGRLGWSHSDETL